MQTPRDQRQSVLTSLQNLPLMPALLLISLMILLTSCSGIGTRQRTGVDVEVDLFVVFLPDTSDDQVNQFWFNVIGESDFGSSEFDLLPGIGGVSRASTIDGYKAVSIDFFPYAERAEIEFVIKQIEASPIVYKLLKDVVPSDVYAIE